MSVSARSNVYALILGINRYQADDPDYPDLHAAVNDANAFERFLLHKLNVPASQIINLRDEEASRENIVKALSDGLLSLTSDCPEAPAIVIYYAGHGASTEKPKEWETWATNSSNIELLCPSDMGLPRAEGSLDVIEGIPDRTICYLLNRLSRARGNNITLILDCCCSAGINRNAMSPESQGYIPRRIQKPPPLSPRVDRPIYYATDGQADRLSLDFAGGFTGHFQDSHVLMAACGREQRAYEKDGSGLFTQRLLSALESCGVLTTTYDGLLTRLQMPKWQTPHFEGKNMNRLLFNVKGSRSDPCLIPVRRRKIDGVKLFLLEAGSAHGVVENACFDIHETNILDSGDGARTNPSLGRLVAATVDSFTSRLEFPPGVRFKVPSHFYARWADHRQLPISVYSEDRQWLQELFPERLRGDLGVRLVEAKEQASLLLTLEGDVIYFDRNDTITQPYIGSRFPRAVLRTDTSVVYDVVRRWRTFNYHLARPSPLELPGVRMELHYLKQTGSDEWDEPVYEPIGDNLLAAEPAIVEAQGDFIGVTLHNDSDVPLYPFLFYFDPNDLTIVSWNCTPLGGGEGKYLPEGSWDCTPLGGCEGKYLPQGVDCPLLPHSRLPLGYGNGGAPWEFFLDGKEKDVGFFKLFVAASPANFASLEQSTSPFEGEADKGHSRGRAEDDKAWDTQAWGTKTYTLIQVMTSK